VLGCWRTLLSVATVLSGRWSGFTKNIFQMWLELPIRAYGSLWFPYARELAKWYLASQTVSNKATNRRINHCICMFVHNLFHIFCWLWFLQLITWREKLTDKNIYATQVINNMFIISITFVSK